MKYDFIIVGGGPAGLSAALSARMRSLKTLLIYSGDGALGKTARVDNYPGMPNATGPEMLNIMRNQASELGVEFAKGLVQKIMQSGCLFSVLAGNFVYEARTVLLACGVSRISVLPGEERWLGQGISYCATCDGMFYKGKQIIVIASSDEAVEEANYLSELGNVRYIKEKPHKSDGLNENINIIEGKPLNIIREQNKMRLTTDGGELYADGLFVIRPTVALTQMLPELELDKGNILVDDEMKTSIPGVFAAGDMVGQPLQIAKAVGEGNIAALAISRYLNNQDKNK